MIHTKNFSFSTLITYLWMQYVLFKGEDLISPVGNRKISVFDGFKFMNWGHLTASSIASI